MSSGEWKNLRRGGKYYSAYNFFTYTSCFIVGVAYVGWGIDEKMENGEDHSLSSTKRLIERIKDKFLDT